MRVMTQLAIVSILVLLPGALQSQSRPARLGMHVKFGAVQGAFVFIDGEQFNKENPAILDQHRRWFDVTPGTHTVTGIIRNVYGGNVSIDPITLTFDAAPEVEYMFKWETTKGVTLGDVIVANWKATIIETATQKVVSTEIQPYVMSDPHTRIDAKEEDPYRPNGDGSVDGVVVLRSRRGDLVPAVKKNVFIVPALARVEEYLAHWVLGEMVRGYVQPKTVRTVKTDGAGFFRFKKLPSGTYFVLCDSDWMDGRGLALAKVTVAAGSGVTGVKVEPR